MSLNPLQSLHWSFPRGPLEHYYLHPQYGLENLRELSQLFQLQEESPHSHHSLKLSWSVSFSYSSSQKQKENHKKRVLITFTLRHNIAVKKKGNSIVLQPPPIDVSLLTPMVKTLLDVTRCDFWIPKTYSMIRSLSQKIGTISDCTGVLDKSEVLFKLFYIVHRI